VQNDAKWRQTGSDASGTHRDWYMHVQVNAPEHFTSFLNIFRTFLCLKWQKVVQNDVKWRQTGSGPSGTYRDWYMQVRVDAPEHLTSFLNIFETFNDRNGKKWRKLMLNSARPEVQLHT
jgi:hypothetical protein